MGFLDKAKAAAGDLSSRADAALANAGLGGPGSATTSGGDVERLFRDLGVLAYLEHSGREVPAAERMRVLAALQDAEQRGAVRSFALQTPPPPAPGAGGPGASGGGGAGQGTSAPPPPPGAAGAPYAPPPPPGSPDLTSPPQGPTDPSAAPAPATPPPTTPPPTTPPPTTPPPTTPPPPPPSWAQNP